MRPPRAGGFGCFSETRLQGQFHSLINGKALQRGFFFGDDLPAVGDHVVDGRVESVLVVMEKPQLFDAGIQRKFHRLFDGGVPPADPFGILFIPVFSVVNQ